ncbi:MAG: amidohydrolase family protein [Candidatus Micrarchaeota archaeon]
MGVLLKNGLVVTQNKKRQIQRLSILVEGNRITRIAKDIEEKAEFVIDCSNKLVMPGLSNTHGHLAMTLFRGYGDDMVLGEWLSKKIWPAEAKLTGDDVYWGSLFACLEMTKSGTTSCADMYFFMERSAEAVSKSGMRGLLCHGMIDLGDSEKADKELNASVSFISDWHGKGDGRISCSLGPHSIYTCSKDLLEKTVVLSKKKNLKVQLHLAETRKELNDSKKNFGKGPVEYAESLGLLMPNTVLAHCGWLSMSEIRTVAKKGAYVSHNPESNLKLASGIAPVSEMIGEGVSVSLGTDGAASNNSLSLFSSMKTCALIHKANRWDATVVNAQQTLDMATINGAKALGFDSGSLEEGKLADIITLDLNSPSLNPQHNLISNLVYSENGSSVRDVIIDGKIVMQNRKMLVFDEKFVIEKARKTAGDLVSRTV